MLRMENIGILGKLTKSFTEKKGITQELKSAIFSVRGGVYLTILIPTQNEKQYL
jgi:hypothetical protein